jgi:uncharacterized protein VirK/YbjX
MDIDKRYKWDTNGNFVSHPLEKYKRERKLKYIIDNKITTPILQEFRIRLSCQARVRGLFEQYQYRTSNLMMAIYLAEEVNSKKIDIVQFRFIEGKKTVDRLCNVEYRKGRNGNWYKKRVKKS